MVQHVQLTLQSGLKSLCPGFSKYYIMMQKCITFVTVAFRVAFIKCVAVPLLSCSKVVCNEAWYNISHFDAFNDTINTTFHR